MSIIHLLFKSTTLRKFLYYALPGVYGRLIFYRNTGRVLSYKNPTGFEEKLFWLEKNYKSISVKNCTDKYEVRNYVRERGLERILNELHGVFHKTSEISWNNLPESFAIKATHASGWNIIVRNKGDFDKKSTLSKIDFFLKERYGWKMGEFHYKGLIPKIVIEKYLQTPQFEMWEIQFFCINGEPQFILARNDLGDAHPEGRAITFNLHWERVFFRKNEETLLNDRFKKPDFLGDVTACAKILAEPFPQVRVDFLVVGDRFFFGEMTFSTSGNIFHNFKEGIIADLGEKLKLSAIP